VSDLDPRLQFLIDNEHRKLGWMEEGPAKEQAKHLAKVFVMSQPWDEMIDWYNEIKWSEDHGKIRVIQYVGVHEDTGAPILTRWMIEQNINGQWTKVPVTYVNEGDA
jgi:hypothetical protein